MTVTIRRRELLAALGGAAAAWVLVTGGAHAQSDFPNRHIHMIVPYPAGGIVDIATRIVTDKLSEIWRQPIVVETKPGASGNLAWDQVSRAKPDGYTWTFLGPATMANPHMYANLRWSEKSFVPVGATVWGAIGPRCSPEASGQYGHRVRRSCPEKSGRSQLGHPCHRQQPISRHGHLSQRDEARHDGRALQRRTASHPGPDG